MANGLDRFERLFAYKRKASHSPHGNASPAQSLDQKFPSPSFIRPKTSRMTARQEVRLRQATERSPSVPDMYSTSRISQGQISGSVSADGNCQLHQRQGVSPTFSQRQTEKLVFGLRQFQFSKPPGRNGDMLPSSMTLKNQKFIGAPQIPSPRCPSPLEITIPLPKGLDTPPSYPEHDAMVSPKTTSKHYQDLLLSRLPTPDQSPRVQLVQDLQPRSVKSVDYVRKTSFQAVEDQLGEPFDQLSLGRTCSQSSIAQSAHSFCSSTLREPDFNEFLNLSDDDIAESTPGSPALEALEEVDLASPTALNLWISSSEPLVSRLLTLTPPRASRPAAAAAFEAARIARRYDFDLVYVVNLWPDTSSSTVSGQNPMVGRLLAAHGLHHVPSPLQISEEVHTTFLRSSGWIEFRNQEALPQDLARGFACAFYTGQYSQSASSRCASPVSGIRLSERIDRGIVFAAYRKPRIEGDKLGRTFGDTELGELYRDAEVLVEMVIDIHVANRSRHPASRTSLTGDTGPIPAQIKIG